jgi:hypothetical protein
VAIETVRTGSRAIIRAARTRTAQIDRSGARRRTLGGRRR